MPLTNEQAKFHAGFPHSPNSPEPGPILHQISPSPGAFPGNNDVPWGAPFSFFPAYPESLLYPFASPPVKKITSIKDIKSFEDIKVIVDQLGGIEGIISYMTKLQRILQAIQQMSPMFKLLAKSFLKEKGAGVRSHSPGFKKTRKRRKKRRSFKRKAGKKG